MAYGMAAMTYIYHHPQQFTGFLGWDFVAAALIFVGGIAAACFAKSTR